MSEVFANIFLGIIVLGIFSAIVCRIVVPILTIAGAFLCDIHTEYEAGRISKFDIISTPLVIGFGVAAFYFVGKYLRN